jgi:hypothetical protein
MTVPQFTADRTSLSETVDQIARSLTSVEHRNGASFIRTGSLYPDGSSVIVRIQGGPTHFLVSDAAFGYQEADLLGASHSYGRYARHLAETAGIRFDGYTIFDTDVPRDQLLGAVLSVAECSHGAVCITAHKLSERRISDASERLYERLVSVFSAPKVAKDVEIIGSSGTQWAFSALVGQFGSKKSTVFEPVTNHHSSVAHVSMKFRDVALLEVAPRRVAVAHRKRDFGTMLGVISQTADVIDEEIPTYDLERLARHD